MKNTLSIFAAAAVSVLSLVSCGDDDKSGDAPVAPVSISASVENISMDASGGTTSFMVTSGAEWDAAVSESWISLSKAGTTSQTGTVGVTVKPNESREPRSGEIILMSGRARARVGVSQQGKVPEPVDPSIKVPEGYTLVWNDEFDGADALDLSKWTYEAQRPGWVNNELQNYVKGAYDGIPVTTVADGILTITCFKHAGQIYSARIYGSVDKGWTYGIMEARIKLPKGRGTWPAFWMMPVNNDFGKNPWPDCGEIDIMEEVGFHPDYTSSSIHCKAYNHVKNTQKTAERYTAGAEEDFHVYRLEWTKDYIQTYVDDHRLLRFDNDGRGNAATWPFNKPFYIILNLAWGGDWGGAQGVDESALPVSMEVDYVRVFQQL